MAGRIICWDEPDFQDVVFSKKKKFIKGTINVHIEITEEQLLEQYKPIYENLAKKYPDKPKLTDEQIIDDIMVINWAWFKI